MSVAGMRVAVRPGMTTLDSMRTTVATRLLTASLLAVAVSGCSGFLSDNPFGGGGGGGDLLAADAAAGPTAGSAPEDASRAIEEADILKLDGNRLYAVSRSGGLSVIDVSVRDQLTLLGRKRIEATPSEIYLRGNVVIGLFTAWGTSVYNDADAIWEWVVSSRVVAFDVSDPSAIAIVGDFTVPGEISDSRIVGDILYLVSYENGYCWGCNGSTPTTTVSSLDVSTPTAITEVDTLSFADANSQWGWQKRSVTVTTERMYVAGPEWNGGSNLSTVQVVDISDPGGALVQGASFDVAGMISSRWQMDETAGIFRVISQPPDWDLSQPPVVQTFTVANSNQVNPLGQKTLTLPRPEQLRSVRFDGDRAYAITFERTDPLFTIDLSNPAMPKQAGMLEMPGWVYHMEPYGDRVIGLGVDNTSGAGSMNVSLFDVSDLANPTMIDRVEFGGSWASAPEDQDRIHKALALLPTENLILVPYSGWTNVNTGCGSYRSGVQLIDWIGDDLILRGDALTKSRARRAFLHDTRLFAVSEDHVQVFDIDDRDAPTQTASLALSLNIARTVSVGSHIARLARDNWTTGYRIELTTPEGADDPIALGSIDIDQSVVGTDATGCYHYPIDLRSEGDELYLLVQGYDAHSGQANLLIATIDASDPSAPAVDGSITLQGLSGVDYSTWNTLSGYSGAIPQAGSMVSQLGTTLVVRSAGSTYDLWGVSYQARFQVVDLADPGAPRLASTVELPNAMGYGALHTAGGRTYTSHWQDAGGGKIAFYVDVLSAANPDAPSLGSVNVPGALLSIDEGHGNLATMSFERITVPDVTYQTCYETFTWATASFEWGGNGTSDIGTCYGLRRRIHLVSLHGSSASLLDTVTLEDDMAVMDLAQGDDRLFLHAAFGDGTDQRMTVLSGFGGAFTRADLALEVSSPYYYGYYGGWGVVDVGVAADAYYGYVGSSNGLLQADGKRAFFVSSAPRAFNIVDATRATDSTLAGSVDLLGYANHLLLSGGYAYLSLSSEGLQRIDLATAP